MCSNSQKQIYEASKLVSTLCTESTITTTRLRGEHEETGAIGTKLEYTDIVTGHNHCVCASSRTVNGPGVQVHENEN